MSDNTRGGVYCSVCHKRRPASHFEDRPDHAAGGPKLTLAERRELGEDLDSGEGTGEGTGAGGWIAAGIGAAVLVGWAILAWLGRNASGGAGA